MGQGAHLFPPPMPLRASDIAATLSGGDVWICLDVWEVDEPMRELEKSTVSPPSLRNVTGRDNAPPNTEFLKRDTGIPS